jgi:hypothetical protein
MAPILPRSVTTVPKNQIFSNDKDNDTVNLKTQSILKKDSKTVGNLTVFEVFSRDGGEAKNNAGEYHKLTTINLMDDKGHCRRSIFHKVYAPLKNKTATTDASKDNGKIVPKEECTQIRE